MNIRGGITIFRTLGVSKNYSSSTPLTSFLNPNRDQLIFSVGKYQIQVILFNDKKDFTNWIYLICTFFFFWNLIIPNLWIMGRFPIPFA